MNIYNQLQNVLATSKLDRACSQYSWQKSQRLILYEVGSIIVQIQAIPAPRFYKAGVLLATAASNAATIVSYSYKIPKESLLNIKTWKESAPWNMPLMLLA